MLSKITTIIVLIFGAGALAGFAQTPNTSNQTVFDLCNRIPKIKTLPREPGEDAVYDEFIKAGEKTVPCLIEKITDTTIMDDPRCPGITDATTVGDVAFFVLIRITGADLPSFLPEKFRKKFKTEGIYAYHEYIDQDGKRVELQAKVREWYRQKFAKQEK